MPALPINDSPNITSLDSKIVVDGCLGNFLIDVSPSVFTEGGASTSGGVQGASIQIVNPVGVTIDAYPTSGFDIYPPMTSVYSFPIPLIAGIYGYGTYTISVRLTDHDGTNYTVTKSVNFCPPDPDNKNRNYGCMDMDIRGNCRTGVVIFLLQNPPTYKGTAFTSQVNALTIKYPTASGLADTTTTLSSFSLTLYEGQYQVAGTVCVLYNYGDYVYFKVNYKVKCSKIIKCIIDECCVNAKLQELYLRINTIDCTQAEIDNTFYKITQAVNLLKMADLAVYCGEDPSDIISDLEKLLGCICTCSCNEGTAVIGTGSSGTFLYKALLTQAGTAAPVAVTSSLNSVTIVWSYVNTGYYRGTISGLPQDLTANNTFIIMGTPSDVIGDASSQLFMGAGYLSANTIFVWTNDDGAIANGLLNDTPFELSIL